MNKTEFVDLTFFLQLSFTSFFCKARFDDSKHFLKRGPKFPWGPKLEDLTVHRLHMQMSDFPIVAFLQARPSKQQSETALPSRTI